MILIGSVGDRQESRSTRIYYGNPSLILKAFAGRIQSTISTTPIIHLKQVAHIASLRNTLKLHSCVNYIPKPATIYQVL